MPDTLRQRIIREEAFAKILSERARNYLRFLNLLLRRESSKWVKRHYNELVLRSHDLETMLDDHDARNNKAFAYLTELVASLRGFGKVAVALKHLVGRFPRYRVELEPELAGAFFVETEHTSRFLDRSIKALIRALHQEMAAVHATVPEDSLADSSVADDGVRDVLPHNIDEEDILEEERKIAEIATRYMDALQDLRQVTFPGGRGAGTPKELRDFVLHNLDEERARDLEARIHSIQSKYDTYVKATAIESRTPALPGLRGHASLALHLLEMATELLHFYVRHENDVRYEPAKARISDLVDKSQVLDRAVHYAIGFASEVLEAGRGLATEVLDAFVKVSDLVVTVPEGATLHARPITLIVKVVNHYGTYVEMAVGGETCNASSIMEMILAVGNQPEAQRITFRGDHRPLRDLARLFEAGLGERGLESLPEELGYLR